MSTRALVAVGLLLAVGFLVFVIAQVLVLADFAARIHPTFGQGVAIGLGMLFVGLLAYPVVAVLRLPAPLRPPAEASGPAYEQHLAALRTRLRQHALLQDHALSTEADLKAALATLDTAADRVVQQEATRIFLMTAISQFGKLDALVVTALQLRLVWRVAHTYYQRTAPREMIRLYTNVAYAAVIAYAIEEIDVDEQLEPIVGAATSSVMGAVPGMAAASTLLVNSLLSGTANALLTLRVGLIAKRYTRLLSHEPAGKLRRKASLEALAMVRPIVKENAQHLARLIGRKAKASMHAKASDLRQQASDTGARVVRSMAFWRSAEGPPSGAEPAPPSSNPSDPVSDTMQTDA
ncbi:MAG: DUF697 domain-containing protein [Bacteroidetes bacterium]|jgi:hypothetical protein|nr:DUF697 domain-containing protein [Bacteroidota bacterium]